MDDKIKVSLPKTTLELLKKDCEDFKVTKKDGAPNLNAFVNVLIANFYESFSASEESLHDEVRQALTDVAERYREKVFEDIVKIFAKRAERQGEKKDSATFSFKPTKVSEKATAYVENVLLKSESLSSFYRRMFLAYSQKTKNEREKIIYADCFAALQKAIKKGVKACVCFKNGEALKDATVYAVAHSKDELFNYALIYTGKTNTTRRLANIKSVTLLLQKAEIPESNRALFDRQIACAAQYPMYNTDNEPIKVQLTDKGKKLFERIYLYRPTPVSIDGDVYTFDCTKQQLSYYFQRFGDSALILSPKRLGIAMRNYYHFALKKYRTLYKYDN